MSAERMTVRFHLSGGKMTANELMWSQHRMMLEQFAGAVMSITLLVCAAVVLLLTVLVAGVVMARVHAWLEREQGSAQPNSKGSTRAARGTGRWLIARGVGADDRNPLLVPLRRK
jgi:hypothetical protein